MKFDLPQSIDFVLDTLNANGYSAYIVGGCVRDLLCGKIPHDYDITTSANPDAIISLFEKTAATGLKHGTVTVIVGKQQIEVTTFRTENGYSDSRHPDNIQFVTNVSDDLSRRDFTVNAMCYNRSEGIIDLFGGKEDIRNKILRTVGDAKTRFCEDALRIMRLFRFAATLEFSIEQNTFDTAIESAQLLENISAERIFCELKKAACGVAPQAISPILKTSALKNYCISSGDITPLQNLENKESLRTFALLYSVSNNLEETLKRFKCSNKFKSYCQKMKHFTENIINSDKIGIKKALAFADTDTVTDAFFYYRDILKIDITQKLDILDNILKHGEPYLIRHLDITGDDIMSLGISGSKIADALNYLIDEVIINPELNQKEKLIKIINH